MENRLIFLISFHSLVLARINIFRFYTTSYNPLSVHSGSNAHSMYCPFCAFSASPVCAQEPSWDLSHMVIVSSVLSFVCWLQSGPKMCKSRATQAFIQNLCLPFSQSFLFFPHSMISYSQWQHSVLPTRKDPS